MKEVLIYTSRNQMECIRDGLSYPLHSQRVLKYKQALADIQRKHEWKTSGTGARFMGVYQEPSMSGGENENYAITGIAKGEEGQFFYSIAIGEIGGIYRKDYQQDQMEEDLIISSRDFFIEHLCCHGTKLLGALDYGLSEKHIVLFTLPESRYVQLTEGDTMEDHPSWSWKGNGIYFDGRGLSRTENNYVAGVGPGCISYLDMETKEIKEILADDAFDYLKPKEDSEGALYYLKRPYGQKIKSSKNSWMDVLLFPVRIIQAIGSWLNFFTQRYTGESLRTTGAERARQRPEKEMFIQGNLVQVEKALKESQKRKEEFPGLIPGNWQLCRLRPDGQEELVEKGVLDYDLLEGGYVYSNGEYILEVNQSGEKKKVSKAYMAMELSVQPPS